MSSFGLDAEDVKGDQRGRGSLPALGGPGLNKPAPLGNPPLSRPATIDSHPPRQGSPDARKPPADNRPKTQGYPSTTLDPDPSFGFTPSTRLPSTQQQQEYGLDTERAPTSSTPSSSKPTTAPLPPPSSAYGQAPLPSKGPVASSSGGDLPTRQTPPRTHVNEYNQVATQHTKRPETPEDAALVIQRHYRGHRTRREMADVAGLPYGSHAGRPYGSPGRPDQQQPFVMGPVIDITKLPRYGVLAPPLPRPPRVAGQAVAFDRTTNVFTRNRGALREALENKNGWLEDAPLRMWSEFAKRQLHRYVPIPPDANRRLLPETQGYRLRLLRVNDLPVHTTFDGRTFEFQLGVTMYDEAYGVFYGNTVYSQGDGYDHNRAAQRQAIDLDFSFDVFYHTSVSDPRCMAVVEVIMLERMLDGVVKGQYSLGWALLPMFRVGLPGPDGSLCVDQEGAGKPLVVPLVSGTPRYLLMRNVYNEDLRAPKVLQNCSIVFQAESYPAMDPFIPLLPPDFLVTYGDVVPGLRRFDTAGRPSVTTKHVISTMAHPMISPTHSVVLRRLQLALPLKLHELLLALDHKQALPMEGTACQGLPGGPPFTDHTGQLRYTVRVGVHNGRTFVGPCYELANITTMDVPGWKVLQVSTPDPVFDYLMADVMTTVVVELMATPAQAVHPGSCLHQHLVGWCAFVPFCFIADDGSAAEVAVGVHRYVLAAPLAPPAARPAPLNWRSLLGDNITRDIPDAMVEFQLFETGRTPIPPPLRQRFAPLDVPSPVHAASAPGSPPHLPPGPPREQTLQPLLPPALPALNPQPPASPPFLQTACGTPIPPCTPTTSWGGNEATPWREPAAALHDVASSRVFDTSDRDQLRGISDAMQRQIELLTRAVDELKEERKHIRNSMVIMSDRSRTEHTTTTTTTINRPVVTSPPPAVDPRRAGSPTPEEIRRFMEMDPTAANPKGFAGPPQVNPSTVPSRVLLQQLYDAGMVDALPPDVQAILRQRGGLGVPPSLTMDLGIEARDARTASDVVIQLLAFRHHDTLNAPSSLQSAYFTFQFYHFPPTTTDMAFLVQPHPKSHAPVTTGQPGEQPALTGGDDDGMRATRLLMTNHPMKKGAGVVLKYCVDGSTEPLSEGQAATAAAYEAHMGFASYLANKQLNLDMWDGESLLQVGTACIDLAPLLRQGRPYSELLLEVPFMMQDSGAAAQASGVGCLPGAQEAGGPTVLSRGSVVVRLINIGREPRNLKAQPDGGSKVKSANKRTRVRARPAWEVVDSAIARELANGDHPDAGGPGKTPGSPYLAQVDAAGRPVPGGAPAGPGPATHLDAARASLAAPNFGKVQGATADKVAAVKHAILERSHRKSCRVRQLQTILDVDRPASAPPAPLPPPGALGDEAFRRVQDQLLTDVGAARGRHKEHYIRDQLRKNMVIRQVVKPGYGEILVYEHELVNPYTHETVFELRISHPREVCVLTRQDEYRALKAGGARFLGAPSQPVGQLEQEVMAGNRVYLQAHERITIPFKIQSLSPPKGYASAASASAVTQAPDAKHADKHKEGGEGPDAEGHHVVCVEVLSVSHGHPVGVLELAICPRPLIIDRTFRFYHAEHSLMRQTIKLKHLPGADSAFAGGALRTLAVAASHPEVITGTGGAGLTGGAADRDEVYIKYKCGGAPSVTHFYVLLYADRLLSRPLEVWQVYVHAQRKVDLRAQVGQTSTASVVVRGAASSRRVALYSSHPDELQATPDSFVLVAGALTELLLSFRPVTASAKDIKVHLVDVETRELVYALIVAAEAQGPLVTRTFEMELPAGSVANKKITYTNPYQSFRTFTFRCNQPWLMSFTPPRLQLPAGATRPLGLTFDARAATCGIIDVLVFVNDEEDRTEECFRVRCRIYR